MRARSNVLWAAVLVVGVVVGLSGTAVAGDYPPNPPGPGKRSLDVSAFSPDCIADAPYISYTIVPVGFASTGPADLTIRDINGDIVAEHTVEDLTGRLVYPGAEVSADGTTTDWPGWIYDDGMWLRDPSDAHLRDGLTITVEVASTTAVATVAYPDANSGCAGPSASSSPPTRSAASDSLPDTGSDTSFALRIAALTLGAGLAVTAMLRLRTARRSA
jgi:hypothetical protein